MTELQSFHEQIKRGGLEAVRSSLQENPALLDAKNEAGQSALLLAKYYRQEEVAHYLASLDPQLDIFLASAIGQSDKVFQELDRDPSLLEAHSSDGWTPLHLAAFFGQDELAKALLKRGAQVDSRSTNQMRNTPLHAAAAGRQLGAMRVLLEHGADANASQEGGWTALHGAAQNGDRTMAELLIANGADVGTRAANNQSPLDLALMKGNSEMADLLEQLAPEH